MESVIRTGDADWTQGDLQGTNTGTLVREKRQSGPGREELGFKHTREPETIGHR